MKARHFFIVLKVPAPKTCNKEDSNKENNYFSEILIDFLTLFAIGAGVGELLAAVACRVTRHRIMLHTNSPLK
jgi:hypothetical protein